MDKKATQMLSKIISLELGKACDGKGQLRAEPRTKLKSFCQRTEAGPHQGTILTPRGGVWHYLSDGISELVDH